jgi:hypothetical protein
MVGFEIRNKPSQMQFCFLDRAFFNNEENNQQNALGIKVVPCTRSEGV